MKIFDDKWQAINVSVIAFGVVAAIVMWALELTSYGAGDDTISTIADARDHPARAEMAAPSATLPPVTDTADDWTPDPAEVEAAAKTLYMECRGVTSKTQRAAVLWCVLNRVDSPKYPDKLLEVLEQPNQFAYDVNAPVLDSLADLAADVLIRHHYERNGCANVGRVLPPEYLYFVGDGTFNYFTVEWRGTDYWTWEMETPYED